MLNKLITYIVSFFAFEIACKNDNNRQDSNALLKNNTDTTSKYSKLKSDGYNAFKLGEYKEDLASAAEFIEQGESQNVKIKSSEIKEYQTLLESCQYNERTPLQIVKPFVDNYIQILESPKDKFHLSMAFLERIIYLQ